MRIGLLVPSQCSYNLVSIGFLQETADALQAYPSDHSPGYLQQRLTQISDPGDMKVKVTRSASDHDSLMERLQQGRQRYDTLLNERQEFESDIETQLASLQEQVDHLSESCLTEDWREESADAVLNALQV